MLGENEDSYVKSCIQTQNTGIAYETLLTLQLLEHEENGEQRTTKQLAEEGSYSNAGLSVSSCGRGLNNVMSNCLENQNTCLVRLIWFNGD